MKTFPQAVSAAALLATAVISLMPPAIAQGLAPVSVLPVQGNVYMFYSRSGNVAVSIGDQGALVVDTPAEGLESDVIAEIRKLTKKPIRYVIDTSINRVATNAQIARAGVATGGILGGGAFDNGAIIISHENLLARMSDVPEGQKVPNPIPCRRRPTTKRRRKSSSTANR